MEILGRSLLECGIIRFHQQRKYALDALRLLLEMDSDEDDRDEGALSLEAAQVYVFERIFNSGPGSANAGQRLVPRCMAAMQTTKTWLQKLGDKISAAQALGQSRPGNMSEEAETIEFSRVSLIQQHELLAIILSKSVEKRQADVSDFTDFMTSLRRIDKYDNLLIHLVPAIGTYMTAFGSVDGGYDLIKVRELNNKLFPTTGEPAWGLPYFQAAVRSWWLVEYSGFYLDDPPEAAIPPNTDLDEGRHDAPVGCLQMLTHEQRTVKEPRCSKTRSRKALLTFCFRSLATRAPRTGTTPFELGCTDGFNGSRLPWAPIWFSSPTSSA